MKRSSGRRRRLLVGLGLFGSIAAALSILAAAGAVALPSLGTTPTGPNDLAALGQGVGQTPTRAATVRRAEPPLVATPRARCGAGSHPEPGIQGRVPAGSGNGGLWIG
jgi:hypothetical protein